MAQQISKNRWLPSNMKSRQFLLDSRNVALISGLFALILVPLGIYANMTNSQLMEVTLDYTRCKLDATADLSQPTIKSDIARWKYDASTRQCTVEFNIPSSLEKEVFMYIRLTNMFQNARQYMKSMDPGQLDGVLYRSAADIPSSLTSCAFLQYANCQTATENTWIGNGLTHAQSNPDCQPIATSRAPVINNADKDAQYYPCGLIANSYFSDEISPLTCIKDGCTANITMSAKGIAWPEDASQYKQSPWQTDAALASFVPTFVIPPPQWRAAWPLKYGDGYTAESLPRLDQDERFQVWMRKAGLSTFRKLWGRSKSHIEPGTYQVTITDKWDAMRFEGTKSLVFGEVGFLGPKNLFLGLSLLIVGLLCLISAIAVSTIRIRRLGDPALFSWNKLKTS